MTTRVLIAAYVLAVCVVFISNAPAARAAAGPEEDQAAIRSQLPAILSARFGGAGREGYTDLQGAAPGMHCGFTAIRRPSAQELIDRDHVSRSLADSAIATLGLPPPFSA